ncbi:integrase catalytic domain-containing protein, partial [Nephila pilipes]
YALDDKVWVTLHPKSNAAKGKIAKLIPKRDGPIFIITQRSLTAYEVAHAAKPHVPKGYYRVSALKRRLDENSELLIPLRKRSKPKTLDPNPNPSTALK